MPKGNPHPNTSGLKPPWQAGKSGNPTGVLGRKLPMTDAYNWFLSQPAFDTDVEKIRDKGMELPEHPTQAHVIAYGQGRRAITKPDSAKLLQESTEGPLKQRLELTGQDGGPVQVSDVKDRLAQKLLRRK